MSQAKQLAQYHNSGVDGHGFGSPNDAARKQVACDRCRGQKLRCIWDENVGQCRRCAKANVVCMILPPRPMGRPSRPTHRSDSQSKSSYEHIPLQDPQWAAFMQSQSLHAGSCAAMEQDDIDMQGTLTEGTRTDFDDTNRGATARSSIDHLLNGQAAHFSSELFPHSDMLHTNDNLQDLDDNSFLVHSSLMQNANNSYKIPTFRSDKTFVPSRHNNPTMDINRPAAPQLIPPDANSEGDENTDEDLDDRSLCTITKLLRLNLALYKHLTQMNAGQRESPPSVMTPVSPESPSAPSPKPAMVPRMMIGRLLSLTDEFSTLLGQLDLLARFHKIPGSGSDTASPYGSVSSTTTSGNASRCSRSRSSPEASQWKQHDPCTALLVLSCYLHLKQVHARSGLALNQLLSRDVEPEDLPELLPGLVIEGFSLAGHGRLQLGMTAKLCEQMFNSIGPCMGLDDSVYDAAPSGLDELVEKIWGLFGREKSS